MDDRLVTLFNIRKRHCEPCLKRTGVILSFALILAVAVSLSILIVPVQAPGSDILLANPPTAIVIPRTATMPFGISAPFSGGAVTPVPIKTVTVENQSHNPIATHEQPLSFNDEVDKFVLSHSNDSLAEESMASELVLNVTVIPAQNEELELIIPEEVMDTSNDSDESRSTGSLLPNSELFISPAESNFDTHGFINDAGGYLSTYTNRIGSTGIASGADVIDRIVLEYSINPRLLLACLEYQSGWVYGQPSNEMAERYPLGHVDTTENDLYLQSAWFANRVTDGYNSWREGRMPAIYFKDGKVIDLDPEINAATAGLMYAFSHLFEYDIWVDIFYGEDNFFIFYENMFGNPWIRS